MSFGENLRRIRKKRGLTQAELAKLLGASRSAIGNWENGRREPKIASTRTSISQYEKNIQFPGQGTMAALAEVLGVSLNELLTGEPEEKRIARQKIEISIKIDGKEIMYWSNEEV